MSIQAFVLIKYTAPLLPVDFSWREPGCYALNHNFHPSDIFITESQGSLTVSHSFPFFFFYLSGFYINTYYQWG